MQRADIILLVCGAVAAIVLIMLFGFTRALFLRRRRKRQAAQAWRAPMPQAEHSAIAEIRREADESHQVYLKRAAADTERRISAQWLRDGKIELKPKKPPEEIP